MSLEQARAHLQQLLVKLGFGDAEIMSNHTAPDQVEFTITVSEGGSSLIGDSGTTLAALEHLTRSGVRRFAPELRLTVDVNQYRHGREEALRAQAQAAAQQAQENHQAVTLEPMSAADRRTVHTALAENADITTESVGQEPHRRIVIRPRV